MRLLSIFILTLGSPVLFAQAGNNTRWNKVEQAEWDIKVCSYDSTADAIILMDKAEISFRPGSVVIQRHRRIKILKSSGFGYADIELPYYKKEGFEDIHNIRAQSLLLGDGGKINRIEVKDFYKEEVNDNWAAIKFSLPAIEVGTIIEYQYEKSSKNFYFLEPWTFQNELPTQWSHLKISVPPGLNYNLLKYGERLKAKYAEGEHSEWILENLESYNSEGYVYQPKDYMEQIRFQLVSYDSRDQMGGGLKQVSVLKSWDELAEEVMQEYKPFLNKSKWAQEELAGVNLDEELTGRLSQMLSLFRAKYAWDGFYSLFPRQDFQEFLTSGKGSSASLNLALITWLRSQGFTVDPVLISTRKHGKVTQNYPLLDQFNHVIGRVELPGRTCLIDAVGNGSPLPYDVLPVEDLNFFGFHLGEKNHEWIPIEVYDRSRYNTIVSLDWAKNTGMLQYKLEGYFAAENRNKVVKDNQPLYGNATFESAIGQSVQVDKAKIEKASEQVNNPLVVAHALQLEPGEGNRRYFSPISWSRHGAPVFKTGKRHFPLELPYPYVENLVISLVVPEGMTLEEFPAAYNLVVNDEGLQPIATFSYTVNKVQDKFMINSRVVVKRNIVPAELYPDWVNFFSQVKSKLEEPLVFIVK